MSQNYIKTKITKPLHVVAEVHGEMNEPSILIETPKLDLAAA